MATAPTAAIALAERCFASARRLRVGSATVAIEIMTASKRWHSRRTTTPLSALRSQTQSPSPWTAT